METKSKSVVSTNKELCVCDMVLVRARTTWAAGHVTLHKAASDKKTTQTVRLRETETRTRGSVSSVVGDPGRFGTPVAEVVFWRRGARPG